MTMNSDLFAYAGAEIPVGATLVLPSPNGIAFMGQLCMDLLITKLNLQRMGVIEAQHVHPLCGPNAFTGDLNDLSTEFEVFMHKDQEKSFVLLQLRSRVAKGYGKAFVDVLTQWMIQSRFVKVVVLTGLDSAFCASPQLSFARLGYLTSSENESTKLASLGAGQLPPPMNESLIPDTSKFLSPGAGLCNLLLRQLNDRQVDWAMFAWFVGEGDNTGPAIAFASSVSQAVLAREVSMNEEWTLPHSWQLKLQPRQLDLTEMIY